MRKHLVILGQGFSASAVARDARAAGWKVTGFRREPEGAAGIHAFSDAGDILKSATHVLCSIPPTDDEDPALLRYGPLLRSLPGLEWIGYFSTTGVYGDRKGAWVDEETPAAPTQSRSQARVRAENAWLALGSQRGISVDIMRLGGIYGPGRSAFETLRSPKARLINAPNHFFSRIHRDDIAGATLAAIETAQGQRILNFVDNTPSTQEALILEAARLIKHPLPPRFSLAEAWPLLSPMAQSFWSERRKVRSLKTQQQIGRKWLYPSYREGLAAIVAQSVVPHDNAPG